MIKAKIKKIVASAIAVTNILMATPINVYAKWKEWDNDHYGYIENNELYKRWKLLDYTCLYEGESLSEDSSVEKAWYYFDETGIMKTDSWVKSGDKWYYLRDDGSMAKNCFIDGYPIDMYGAWISDGGWKKDNNGWWFSYGSGKGYAVDWKAFEDPYFDACDDKTFDNGYINYYFGRDGYM